MIEAGDVLDVMPPNKKPFATAQPNQQFRPNPRHTPRAAAPESIKRTIKAPPLAKSKLQFAPLLALTYLLGPLAILLTPAGRRQKTSLALAGLSVAATIVLVLGRFGSLVSAEKPASAWLWVGLLAVAAVAGFTAWARAVHVAGRDGVPHVNKLPHWLRRNWAIASLGLIAPGSGLLLSGRRSQASVSLWLMWPAVAAVVILINAMGLWQHHQVSGWLAASGPALETAFMIAAAIVALGFLGYLAQALEGMRQVLVEPGLKTKVKGDYYALAVVAVVVVMVVVANPVQMAHQLDVGGDLLREDGYQVIPLQLTNVASRLDPANSAYALQAMALYEELGEVEKAAAVRAHLDQNLRTYVAMVQKEAVAEFGLKPAQAKTQSKLRPAVVRPTEPAGGQLNEAVAKATGLPAGQTATLAAANPLAFLGTLLGSEEIAVAANDSTVSKRRPKVTRAMGMPMGPPLPLSDVDSSAQQNMAPRK